MKTNQIICQEMSPDEILTYLRWRYTNVSSRSSALVKLKRHFMKTRDQDFGDQLKLSPEEYKQLRSHRQRSQIKCSKTASKTAAKTKLQAIQFYLKTHTDLELV